MELPEKVGFENYNELKNTNNSRFIAVSDLTKNDQKNSIEHIITDLYAIDIKKKSSEKLFDCYEKYFKKRFINISISDSETLNSFFGLKFQQFTRHIEDDYKISVDTFFIKLSYIYLIKITIIMNLRKLIFRSGLILKMMLISIWDMKLA